MFDCLCIFEDSQATRFFPLTLSRSVMDLPLGGGTLGSRIRDRHPAPHTLLLCRDYLARPTAKANPEAEVNARPKGRTLFVNARLQGLDQFAPIPKESGTVLLDGDQLASALLEEGPAGELASTIRSGLDDRSCEARLAEIARADRAPVREEPIPLDRLGSARRARSEVPLLRHPWELVHRNPLALAADLAGENARQIHEAAHLDPSVVLEGDSRIEIRSGAVIHGGVVLDATGGPILIEEDVEILPLASLRGSIRVGRGTRISSGARIHGGTSLGPVCRVGGEVAETLIAGYSNKQHDGFLGHSVIGSWVNLGAGTNTSDLKNNYSEVRFWVEGRMTSTGERFVGLLAGDHVKTGIGSLLNTGTYLGFSSTLFGAELPPKFVPSFSWGRGEEIADHDLEKAVRTARVVMERRDVSFDQTHDRLFRTLHAWRRLSKARV